MDHSTLAALLNNRQYRKEMTRDEEKQAEENNLLVIFGASDDLVEFRGVIDDEYGSFNGTSLWISESCEIMESKAKEKCFLIDVEWSPKDSELSWLITTDVPHSKFTIKENDIDYCSGIVVDMNSAFNTFTKGCEYNVFVFGSNLGGFHGAGAALFAKEQWGAKIGEGVGITGSAYAIPTKDAEIKTMPLSKIKPHIDVFVDYALNHKNVKFGLTHIGCGLAGYSWDKDIRPLFPEILPPNIIVLNPAGN